MSEELTVWANESRTQGFPSNYTKTDVEMGAMRLFDRLRFNAGKSQRERRRAFEEVWEASDSNPEAVAYAFGAALRAHIYSMAYVRACAKGYVPETTTAPLVDVAVNKPAPSSKFKFNMPLVKPDPPKAPAKPRKKKTVVPEEPKPDIEWS